MTLSFDRKGAEESTYKVALERRVVETVMSCIYIYSPPRHIKYMNAIVGGMYDWEIRFFD